MNEYQARPVYRGMFVPLTEYCAGDVVEHNHVRWRALADVTATFYTPDLDPRWVRIEGAT